jgi:hypothetical protein
VKSEPLTVRGNQATAVTLVFDEPVGSIKGVVTDHTGQPVIDAFITAARESGAEPVDLDNLDPTWWWDQRPVLSGTDGTFTITKLPHGNYTIRAVRKGGGAAIAEHVPIGGTAKLEIKRTATISGVARSKRPLDELTINVENATVFRSEQFFRSSGAFVIDDLPSGRFKLIAGAEGHQGQIEIDLAEGDRKTDVVIDLAEFVTITGRLVDHMTRAPIEGVMLNPTAPDGETGFVFRDEEGRTTDANGRFTIKQAPRGRIHLSGNLARYPYSDVYASRTIRGPNGDLGDIPMIRKRVAPDGTRGDTGLGFTGGHRSDDPDAFKLEIVRVAPLSPAAKAGIQVGDIVTSIDGFDLTGGNGMNVFMLLDAPPDTKLTIGLARGVTVELVHKRGSYSTPNAAVTSTSFTPSGATTTRS